MPRYIDADALISDSRICGNCKDYELCDGNIAFCPNASARRAINNAPTVETEPVKGWISVKERLPDDCVEVFVHDTYCGVLIGWYEKKDSIFACEFINQLDAVTHWMPLPEPPKGE